MLQPIFQTMETSHKLFILTNLQTLLEFAQANFSYFLDIAKEEKQPDKILSYSNGLSIIFELRKITEHCCKLEQDTPPQS